METKAMKNIAKIASLDLIIFDRATLLYCFKIFGDSNQKTLNMSRKQNQFNLTLKLMQIIII